MGPLLYQILVKGHQQIPKAFDVGAVCRVTERSKFFDSDAHLIDGFAYFLAGRFAQWFICHGSENRVGSARQQLWRSSRGVSKFSN